VVLTDYPDEALLDNLSYNVEQNVQPPLRAAVCVLGYVWGSFVDPLLGALLPETATEPDVDANADAGPATSFDLILLSDLIFNHSQVRHPIICRHHCLSSSPLFLLSLVGNE